MRVRPPAFHRMLRSRMTRPQPAVSRRLFTATTANMSNTHAHTAGKVNIPAEEPSAPLKLGAKLVGLCGRQYQIARMLQQRTEPVLSCVYLAITQEHEKYVAKNIYHAEFEYQLDLQRPLADCHHLRTVVDTVPDHLLFLYPYLAADLLELARKESLSDAARKRILRDSLAGLAGLHDQNILHSGKLPNNIFVDYDESPSGVIDVKAVQIGDLEMGCAIPPGLNVRGARLGNPMWRSPEAHAAGHMNLPSDVFSFGLVCIYTMLRRIVLGIVDEDGIEKIDVGAVEGLGFSPWTCKFASCGFREDAMLRNSGISIPCQAFSCSFSTRTRLDFLPTAPTPSQQHWPHRN
ncbi:kinase-like domain-containing protein [Triangularia verruculosa]|uniref:Kinase-like domain-containing protein n=1 Tax=Triangularia verruculosa TaxID=2587418 RepID=A0AAN6XLH1_9PEZI|nr:kinase-like domain-containing protein [Triangularia verruculosa]